MSPVDPTKPAAKRPVRASAEPSSDAVAATLAATGGDPTGGAFLPPALSAGVTAGSLLKAVRRRWLFALSIATAATVAVVLVIFQFVPAYYTSEIRLQLRKPPIYMPNSADEGSLSDDYVRSQAAVLRTTAVDLAVNNAAVRGLEMTQIADFRTWLSKNLVIKPIAGENVLPIKLSADSAEEAARFLTVLIESYKTILREERGDYRERLEQSIQKLDKDLTKLYEKLQAVDVQQLEVARGAFIKTSGDRRQAEAELRAIVNVPAVLDERTVARVLDEEVEKDKQAQDIDTKLVALRSRINSIASASKFGVNDPQIPPFQRDQAKLLEEKGEIRKEVAKRLAGRFKETAESQQKQDVLRLTQKVESLQKAEGDLAVELSKLERRQTPELRKAAEDAKTLETARAKYTETIATIKASGDDVPWVTEMGAPTVPSSRDWATPAKFAALGGVGTFGVVLVLVGLVEFRRRRVTSADDVAIGLGIPTVAAVPNVPVAARRTLGAEADARAESWQGQLMESVDALRTYLLRTMGDGPHVVLVTSAVAGEGKTSLAGQLAASLSRAWRKTLLIDGDLRKPAAHQLFQLPVEPGLCEALRAEMDIVEVVRPTSVSRLWMVSAGHWDAHALQALAQDGVGQLLQQLKDDYDFIVIDSAPVLPVADTLLLGQHVDTVLLSVMQYQSTLPAVYAARRRLAALDIPVLGAVVVGGNSTLGGFNLQYPRYGGQA